MSAILDMPAGNAALKEWLDAQKVQEMSYLTNPFYAMVPKDEDTGGKYYPVPIQYENSQGRSATFANAQGNQSALQLAEFLVTRKKQYGIATADNEALEASMSDRGSFMRFGVGMIKSAMRGCTNGIATGLMRAGTGTIGKISSISSGVITLTNPADVAQFGVNQTIQANSTDGGSPRSALAYVISRSVRNGTVTISATAQGGSAGTPTSWTAGDFLLVQGDNNACASGLPGWLPMTDPTSTDNFYGVNRSADYRLFGVQYDASGQSLEEGLIDHAMLMGREGAQCDTFLTNYGTYAAVCKALGTRRQYVDLEGPAKIGFRGVIVDGPDGPLKVLPDRNCQVNMGFMLQMNTWKLISIGAAPKVLRYEDRNDMLRVYNADSVECRIAAYFNLLTEAPGWNGQQTTSA